DPEDAAARLTMAGLEVAAINQLCPAALDRVISAQITAMQPHPEADKLSLCTVSDGKEELAIVCGASNMHSGDFVALAPVGTRLPNGLAIKKSKIRGIVSYGMLCSTSELGLEEDSAGIMILPAGTPLGESVVKLLKLQDTVLELEITPNRGDCLSVIGVAREMAAIYKRSFEMPTIKLVPRTKAAADLASIEIRDPELCPRYVGRVVEDIVLDESPLWLKTRLRAAGVRSISNVVDVTNYVMLETGQPLHAFDLDLLGERRIEVRRAGPQKDFVTLDAIERQLDSETLMICDGKGTVAVAGIMGGLNSEINPQTKNVLIESAFFQPASIRRSARILKIDSDARYRFERGVDSSFTQDGAEIATQMILDFCGGEASEFFVAGEPPEISRTISYSPKRLRLLGGSDLPAARQKKILSALGFTVEPSGKAFAIPLLDVTVSLPWKPWLVKTPGWRHDVEGAADLIEEILRIDGYDNIPAVPVIREPNKKRTELNPLQKRVVAARHILAGRGLHETVTWSFMDDEKSDMFGAQLHQNKKALTLVNPISADISVMRPSILPNLIEAAGRNADRGIPDAALFEIGGVYKSPEYEGQLTVAAGVRSGNAEPRHWSCPVSRVADAMDAKADALAALKACGVNIGSLQISTDTPKWYHPGRSGVLRLGPTVLAYFGEIHPAVLMALKRDEVSAGFEVFLQNIPLPKKKGSRRKLLKPSPFQPVLRDFAFIVDQEIEAGNLVRIISDTDKSLISGVKIFDVYTGKGVDAGKKSVALAVTLQPVKKTLTDEEISALSAKIIETVQKQTGGILRG
ncbi:MAG: phenylalanine--tRNA ligase subunit beta, partial [Alphaproteobacteria bacterium]|nr:phenylalanine--tRNA ligase subunit beta [Alphaproteobacteria bacterium]